MDFEPTPEQEEAFKKLQEVYEKRAAHPDRELENGWFDTVLDENSILELIATCKSELGLIGYREKNTPKGHWSRERADSGKKNTYMAVIGFLQQAEAGINFANISNDVLMAGKVEENLNIVSSPSEIKEGLSKALRSEKSAEQVENEKVLALRSMELASINHDLILPYFEIAAVQLGEEDEYRSFVVRGCGKEMFRSDNYDRYLAGMYVSSSFTLSELKKHRPSSPRISLKQDLLTEIFDQLLECVEGDVEQAKGKLTEAAEECAFPIPGRGR